MPELPEVETIRRQLEASVVGKKIVGVDVRSAKRMNLLSAEFVAKVQGRRIIGVGRRAKLLMIQLDKGLTMLIHLKMTGHVLLKPKDAEAGKYTFAVFKLADGQQIVWQDLRQFGFLKLVDEADKEKYLAGQKYGPEPLDKNFTAKVLAERLAKHPAKKIKQLLLEQTFVAGLGNIYVVEALHYARVAPRRSAGKLSPVEIKKLHQGIVKILAKAVEKRGTSADDYIDLHGEQGNYVPHLKVYGRAGEECLRNDGGLIKKEKLGGRGTYWCPVCQK